MRTRDILVVAMLGMASLGAAESKTLSRGVTAKADVIESPPLFAAGPIDEGCKSGGDIRTSDLCAQWKAADAASDGTRWAFWQVVLGGIGLGLGTFTMGAAVAAAIYAKRAANAAEGAIAIARSNSEMELRAWVSLQVAEIGGFKIVNDMPHFTASLHASNLGQSPAKSVSITLSMIFGTGVREDIDATVAAYRSGEIKYHDTILFPGEVFTHTYSCEHEGDAPGPTAVGICVLTAYRTVFDDDLRFTARAFQLIDLRRGDDMIDFKSLPGKTVLHLRPHESYLGYTT